MRRPLIAAALTIALAPAAFAADAGSVLRFASHLQALRFSGDLRLRHETIDRKQKDSNDRSRFRYRLRVGTELQLPEELFVALRLGAGTGEQTSNNQTFDNLSTQKQIFVDQAFVRWSPNAGDNTVVRLSGGKTTNWLWRPYSSDLIFDDDFNPEGFQENIEWQTPFGLSVFGNALQMVVDEDADRVLNQWLFSQQAGLEARLPFETRLRTAVAYHKWSDEQHSSFGHVTGGFNDGNRRFGGVVPGAVANRFGVGEWTSELSGRVKGVPVKAQVTLARNFRARGDLGGPTARDGHQYGVIIGRTKVRGQLEFGAFRKYSQTDVTVADVADSDFGDGGTNRQGAIFWLGYALRDYAVARAKYFVTNVVDTNFPAVAAHPTLGAYNAGPGDKPINRLQLDLQLMF